MLVVTADGLVNIVHDVQNVVLQKNVLTVCWSHWSTTPNDYNYLH